MPAVQKSHGRAAHGAHQADNRTPCPKAAAQPIQPAMAAFGGPPGRAAVTLTQSFANLILLLGHGIARRVDTGSC
jgi:hypothetical protein